MIGAGRQSTKWRLQVLITMLSSEKINLARQQAVEKGHRGINKQSRISKLTVGERHHKMRQLGWTEYDEKARSRGREHTEVAM